jgi:hypothetical protein
MGRIYSTQRGDRNTYKVLVRKPEGKRPLESDLGVLGRIILKWILEK